MKTIPSLETSGRAKRIVERLHTPFDNEKRWAIVEEELQLLKNAIANMVEKHLVQEEGTDYGTCEMIKNFK